MKMKVLASVLLAALLAGCSQYQLVPAGRVDLLDKGEVTTPIAWNSLADKEAITWTQDGPLLQNLYFHLGIEDGKTLFRALDKEADQNPLLVLAGKEKDVLSFRFRKTMTEPEIMDLFAASWGQIAGDVPVKTTGLAPAMLGGQPGFRFDYSFAGKDDVARKGFATGAVMDGKLYIIHYFGSALYHFDKHRAEAEQVVESYVFPKKTS